MPSPRNTISFAMTLTSLEGNEAASSPTILGSHLFYRNVSGCRVVPVTHNITNIGSYGFRNWGSHSNDVKFSYLTAACSVGLTLQEIDLFKVRLDKCISKFESRSKTDEEH